MFYRIMLSPYFKNLSFLRFNVFKYIKRNYTMPAIQIDNDIDITYCNEINLDHGYVCPLCKDKGVLLCKICREGCLMCGYSGYVLCRCQLDV